MTHKKVLFCFVLSYEFPGLGNVPSSFVFYPKKEKKKKEEEEEIELCIPIHLSLYIQSNLSKTEVLCFIGIHKSD